MQRITRIVFWLEGVVLSPDSMHQIQPGMARILDELHQRFELLLISQYPEQQVKTIVSQIALSHWFENKLIYCLPDDVMTHQAVLQSLIERVVIIPGQSLLIDDHPIRTILAVREGIDASIFVDSRRLYRDLWLWGIVPRAD